MKAKEDTFLSSLRKLPIVVIIRPRKEDLEAISSYRPFFDLIKQLVDIDIQHIEIAWSEHPGWANLIKDIQKSFPEIILGAASITNPVALETVSELGLNYAMSPFWNPTLQKNAEELNQLLIPGAFSPSEICDAYTFGCKLIKLFPATTLGFSYWSQIKTTFTSPPFVIAAGGIKVEDITLWLSKGYDAIVIGRNLIDNGKIEPNFKQVVKQIKCLA
ncbi:bifunctional 4-hydroxy-2-oxoglutarate aldolase/2-dehydro-3-deoxy-phosphogluconate aldolase [Prochlorococcus sp. MIT 1341]|uniref:bifunctional 4-hydroxy-2-oxoglutarate aldolase/2-dehydro-3-deoxy-phosphogluconate aldolase n=1 Tax=Prochlorococcus sp. MIT 1341 TaxID=3096221 RepID=UPI002A747EE1|nr:bifunctional 4-hydroxy-2-oxoglutarate aldolase/2-dehydro-3-deoxy-phosphogluconate aldolase [Prochlorococcus sp. MIT 1341]